MTLATNPIQCIHGDAVSTARCVACDAPICERHHGSAQVGAPIHVNRALGARCVACAGIYGSEMRRVFILVVLASLSVGAVFSHQFLVVALTIPAAVAVHFFFRSRRQLFIAERDAQNHQLPS